MCVGQEKSAALPEWQIERRPPEPPEPHDERLRISEYTTVRIECNDSTLFNLYCGSFGFKLPGFAEASTEQKRLMVLRFLRDELETVLPVLRAMVGQIQPHTTLVEAEVR